MLIYLFILFWGHVHLKHLFCGSSCIYRLQPRLFWRPNTVNMKSNEAPLFLCFALAFCFDHTISWHIYHQLFNSTRSGPTLIGATRNKSKQEVGVDPNRAHNAPKPDNVFSFCPLSLHVSCYLFHHCLRADLQLLLFFTQPSCEVPALFSPSLF